MIKLLVGKEQSSILCKTLGVEMLKPRKSERNLQKNG